jgi:4-hydroxybutyrate CoA-transferase
MPPARLATQGDLAGLLAPGMTVALHGALGESVLFREALAAAPEAADGVRFLGAFVPGFNEFDYAGLHDAARFTGFFTQRGLRTSYAAGRVDIVPLPYSAIGGYLRAQEIDLFVLQAPPPRDGRVSPGLNADFALELAAQAKSVLVHVNPALPWTHAHGTLALDDIDWIVEHELPPDEFPAAEADATAQAVAAQAASLIGDGDVLQIGIGKIQTAILAALADRRDLGFQSGLVSDVVLDLVEAGALTGARKTVEPGRHVTALAAGTRRLYDALGDPAFAFRPAAVTHSVEVLAKLENFVSINSALEIDLFGQCNAEVANGRVVSGVGGFTDFVRGSRLSPGGRSIVALPSTARGASRIVARFAPGRPVTSPRQDADYIVTEHGVASLRHATLEERATRLIAIAAPEHREALERDWREIRKGL